MFGLLGGIFEIVFGAIMVVGLLLGILWVLGLPGDDEEEEMAGLVTANWDRVKRMVDPR